MVGRHAFKSILCSLIVEGKSFNPLGPRYPHVKIETTSLSPWGVKERKWSDTWENYTQWLTQCFWPGVYWILLWPLEICGILLYKVCWIPFPLAGSICVLKAAPYRSLWFDLVGSPSWKISLSLTSAPGRKEIVNRGRCSKDWGILVTCEWELLPHEPKLALAGASDWHPRGGTEAGSGASEWPVVTQLDG